MTRNDSLPSLPLADAIERIIADHGAIPVLLSTLGTIFGRRAPPCLDARDLSDHLRRDLGLPPRPVSGRRHML